MTTTQTRMTTIFNEWARRYAENPKEWGNILGKDGEPVTDYGERCTLYFYKLAEEMDKAKLLPMS